jgi:large subunit ribosomal protein L32
VPAQGTLAPHSSPGWSGRPDVAAILRGRMAVPKRKTSKSRRDKRRAQHGIESPRVNVCPTCGQPKRPHRVCPNCKTYKGREVEPLRSPIP